MAGNDPRDERALLVVARGQSSLLEALREFFAEFGWVDVIEDRRAGAFTAPARATSRADHGDRPSLA